MLAIVMLAYAVSVVVGKAIRDVQYAHVELDDLNLPTCILNYRSAQSDKLKVKSIVGGTN